MLQDGVGKRIKDETERKVSRINKSLELKEKIYREIMKQKDGHNIIQRQHTFVLGLTISYFVLSSFVFTQGILLFLFT